MRTSLNEIKLTEEYLGKQLSASENLLFEARMLASPALGVNVWLQKKLMDLVRLYHRKQLRNKVADYQDCFSRAPENSSYQKKIVELFKSTE